MAGLAAALGADVRVENFDQLAWCRNAAATLDVGDIQGVFAFVRFHHPYMGLPYPPRSAEKFLDREVDAAFLAQTDEEIAEWADAVTIICCEAVGRQGAPGNDETASMAHRINTGSFGNQAYVALHHSDPEVRLAHAEWLAFARTYFRVQAWCLIA